MLRITLIILFGWPLQLFATNLDSLLHIYNTNQAQKDASTLEILIGSEYFKKGVFDSARLFFNTAHTRAIEANDDKTLVKTHNNLGNILADEGKNTEALNHYQQALLLAEKIKDKNSQADVLKNIGALHLSWKRFNEALQYYLKAKTIAIAAGNKILEADCLNNMGTVYEQQENYPYALEVYKQALAIYRSHNLAGKIAMALGNIAIVYKFQKDYPQAINYNMEGLTMAKKMGNKWVEAAILNNIGSLYSASGDFAKCKTFSMQSIDAARQMNALEIIYNAYENMGDAAAAAGFAAESATYYKQSIAAKDSFINAENARQLSELETKYKSAEKDRQILAQQLDINQKKYMLLGSLLLLVLGSLLAYSYYRRYRLRQEKKLQQEIMIQQEEAARGILNAEENERRRIAGELHDGVGQMLTAARLNLAAFKPQLATESKQVTDKFEKALQLVDDSCREVRQVSHAMIPEALRKKGLDIAIREFLDKIDSDVMKITFHSEGLEQSLDPVIESVLFRVIQESVNNALKHSGATHLDISLIHDGSKLSTTIEDNGKGFDTKTPNTMDGIGLQNMQARINYLKGEMEINSSPNLGTFIGIYIPLPT